VPYLKHFDGDCSNSGVFYHLRVCVSHSYRRVLASDENNVKAFVAWTNDLCPRRNRRPTSGSGLSPQALSVWKSLSAIHTRAKLTPVSSHVIRACSRSSRCSFGRPLITRETCGLRDQQFKTLLSHPLLWETSDEYSSLRGWSSRSRSIASRHILVLVKCILQPDRAMT
jgi:hypothetical protein